VDAPRLAGENAGRGVEVSMEIAFEGHVPDGMRKGIQGFLDEAAKGSPNIVERCDVSIPNLRQDATDQQVRIVARFKDGHVAKPVLVSHEQMVHRKVTTRDFMDDLYRGAS
jgi:hypothetical protein